MTKKYILTESQIDKIIFYIYDERIEDWLKSLKPVESLTLKEITKIYDDTEGLDLYVNFAKAIEQRIVGELK